MGGVVECASVQHDAAGVGGDEPGHALEGHALAAPGSPQQAGDAIGGGEGHLKVEFLKLLFDLHFQRHNHTSDQPLGHFSQCSRRSSRLTAIRTAREIATFTATQR